MIINVSKYPIINAFYGINKRKINVLDKLVKNINKEVLICNKLFNNDPCVGEKKKLYITLKNNSRFELNENTYMTITNIDDLMKDKNINIKKNEINDSISNSKLIQLNSKKNDDNNINVNVNTIKNKNIKCNYILSTNVRDENNILEFIIYHIMIGFDKILIIDHLSKIDIRVKINLLPSFYKNKVEVKLFKKEGSFKMHFLNDIVIPYMKKHCNKYFIHLDGDEYINLNNNYNNIDSLLKDFNYPNILNLNWLLFGSNNKDFNDNEHKCLIPTYTKCDKKLNKHFKVFIKVDILDNNTLFINPHQIHNSKKVLTYTNILNKKCDFDNSKKVYDLFISQIPDVKYSKVKAYINHYIIQSKQDYYIRKVNRPRDDTNKNRDITDDLFEKYNDELNENLISFYNKIKNLLKLDNYSFIILRYVINEETDRMWIKCYNSIRKFYKNKIIIIDDNSKKEYISDLKLENCFVINSNFKGRGELLPYYYYLKYRFSKRIIVLHDSMSFRNKINLDKINKYKNFIRIFSFSNKCYNIDITYFNYFCNTIRNGDMVLDFHNKNKKNLIGCFGVCYVIDYNFLKKIDNKYNISNLINVIDTRDKRKTLERFFSCLFELEYNTLKNPDLLGSIFRNLREQKNKDNKSVFIEKNFYGR